MTTEELTATHWMTLKKMVEKAGGVYETRAQAVAFLTDKTGTGAVVTAGPPTLTTPGGASAALDKARPYGRVYGEVEGFPKAVFTQAGFYFNSAGEKI